MHPESLLLSVDPSIEAQDIIEQIQHYTDLIQNEIKHLVNSLFKSSV